jgi:transcriptional regulator with XRE-family HTH domain
MWNMTDLGLEIHRLRTQKKLTQAQASKKWSINQSILSRIETGKIERPSRKALSQLATGLGVNIEVLSSLVPGTSEEFRVGFAHSIWAAPVIPLIMSGLSMKGVKLTSYGDFQPAESYRYFPHWSESKVEGPILTGPSFGCGEVELPSGYARHAQKPTLSTYSALDLDRLLKDRRLDCIIAAKHVFSPSDARILRCARIMDCAGGGQAMLVWRKGSKYSSVLSKIEKNHLTLLPEIARLIRKGRNLSLKTFYGFGTSTERTLDLFGHEADDVFHRQPVVLRDWPFVISQLEKSLADDGAFLFLGWEPFISSVCRRFQNYERRTRIHLSNQKPMPYLSFDIMFNKEEAKRWIVKGTVREFLREIRISTERLKEAITAQEKDSWIVRQIALYLDMDEQTCLTALSRIDFGFLYYPEWLEYQGICQ